MFTTFETSENRLFLVNRGWISKENFDYEADIKTEDSGISIQGVLSPFARFGLNLTDESYEPGWPKLVQQIEYESAVRDLGFDLNSFVLQLSAGSVGALEPIWKPVDLKPSRHYGYALQWFGLAAVLISSFFYYGFKKD